jgi:hypothetical protein
MKYLLLCCFPLLFLTACDDDDQLATNNKEDYLIFGRYGFECLGSCITVYKLQAGQLFADNLEYGFPEPDDFQTTPLSAADFQVAQVLSNEFPEELLETEQRIFGCPDCADQGGFYLSLKRNGTVTTWQIDMDDVDQTAGILNYKARIAEVLENL